MSEPTDNQSVLSALYPFASSEAKEKNANAQGLDDALLKSIGAKARDSLSKP